MNPVRATLRAADGLLDRALCVIGAVAFSQVPEFIQQYLQRLGGHLDEARRQLLQFQQAAAQAGLTLDRLITQANTNPDPAVAKLGGVMTRAITRVDALETAQAAIQGASLWTRPFAFLRHIDTDIARGTWSIFRPAVPTTLDGLVYSLLGMLFLLTVYHCGVKWPIARVRARREARRGNVPI